MSRKASEIEQVLAAYREGWFPMGEPETGEVRWVQPRVRGVFNLEEGGAGAFHVPRSLARTVRRGEFEVRSDKEFERVVRECAEARPGRGSTWLDERIIELFVGLHKAGHAHCVEAWTPEGVLVGGLYGLAIGGAFFAESKFSRPELGGTDASKVCLVHLVHHLRRRGFGLLDVQFWNPHLARFNCVQVARREYLKRLSAAVKLDTSWRPFEGQRTVKEMGPPSRPS